MSLFKREKSVKIDVASVPINISPQISDEFVTNSSQLKAFRRKDTQRTLEKYCALTHNTINYEFLRDADYLLNSEHTGFNPEIALEELKEELIALAEKYIKPTINSEEETSNADNPYTFFTNRSEVLNINNHNDYREKFPDKQTDIQVTLMSLIQIVGIIEKQMINNVEWDKLPSLSNLDKSSLSENLGTLEISPHAKQQRGCTIF